MDTKYQIHKYDYIFNGKISLTIKNNKIFID